MGRLTIPRIECQALAYTIYKQDRTCLRSKLMEILGESGIEGEIVYVIWVSDFPMDYPWDDRHYHEYLEDRPRELSGNEEEIVTRNLSCMPGEVRIYVDTTKSGSLNAGLRWLCGIERSNRTINKRMEFDKNKIETILMEEVHPNPRPIEMRIADFEKWKAEQVEKKKKGIKTVYML